MEEIRLIQGDCIVEMQKLIDEGIKVDLIVTDPPYWHKKSPGKPYSQRNQCLTASKVATSELYSMNGYTMGVMSDFNGDSVSEVMPLMVGLCKIPNCYIFCNETLLPYYAMWAEHNKYMFSVLTWRKPLSILNKNRFSQNCEFIVRIYTYGTGLNRLDDNNLYDRIITDKPIQGKSKSHPTQKPVSIMERFIRLSTNESDTVLDPFMGSGSTGVACKNLNRNFIGIELDEKYFDIAKKRINEPKLM